LSRRRTDGDPVIKLHPAPGRQIIMSLYTDYLNEIETRKGQGLHPKPIEDGALVKRSFAQIKDAGNEHRQTRSSSSSTTRCPARRAPPAKKRNS
jgi:hypothetical protein